MQIYHKLYLTGMLVLDMAMTNYCYNTYGLSPDYNFFESERAEYVESVTSSNKARFISNYTPVYDNIISGMAFLDETVSTGALYADYRKDLGSRITVDGIGVKVPGLAEEIDKRLEIKIDTNYAGDSEVGYIYRADSPVAAVRVKNGLFYRISGTDPVFKIGDIAVGDNIYKAVRKWGMPSDMEPPVYKYSVGDRAAITMITDPQGTVTWMLYESFGREIEPDEENAANFNFESVHGNESAKEEKQRECPVADAVLKYNHTQRDKDKKQEKNK